jgi:hypothetical protein
MSCRGYNIRYMGGACSMHVSEAECMRGFGENARKKSDNQKDPDIGGRLILKWILEK